MRTRFGPVGGVGEVRRAMGVDRALRLRPRVLLDKLFVREAFVLRGDGGEAGVEGRLWALLEVGRRC